MQQRRSAVNTDTSHSKRAKDSSQISLVGSPDTTRITAVNTDRPVTPSVQTQMPVTTQENASPFLPGQLTPILPQESAPDVAAGTKIPCSKKRRNEPIHNSSGPSPLLFGSVTSTQTTGRLNQPPTPVVVYRVVELATLQSGAGRKIVIDYPSVEKMVAGKRAGDFSLENVRIAVISSKDNKLQIKDIDQKEFSLLEQLYLLENPDEAREEAMPSSPKQR